MRSDEVVVLSGACLMDAHVQLLIRRVVKRRAGSPPKRHRQGEAGDRTHDTIRLFGQMKECAAPKAAMELEPRPSQAQRGHAPWSARYRAAP